jgi:hypothetical protein
MFRRNRLSQNNAFVRVLLLVLLTFVLVTGSTYGIRAERSVMAQVSGTVDGHVEQTTIQYLLEDAPSPQEQPRIQRVIIEGNYALATWHWGEAGGQAALIQVEDAWTVLSAGGGALDAATLEDLGVPASTAQGLIERDQAARQ